MITFKHHYWPGLGYGLKAGGKTLPHNKAEEPRQEGMLAFDRGCTSLHMEGPFIPLISCSCVTWESNFFLFQPYLLKFLSEAFRVRGEEALVTQSGLSASYFITFAMKRLSHWSLCQRKFWLQHAFFHPEIPSCFPKYPHTLLLHMF